MIESQLATLVYNTERCWLPCCDREVRLRIPAEEAIHVHERTCSECGRVWTFATDQTQLLALNGWQWATYINLGRPTVPAVREVLQERDEDGWLDSNDRQGMLRLARRINAREAAVIRSDRQAA